MERHCKKLFLSLFLISITICIHAQNESIHVQTTGPEQVNTVKNDNFINSLAGKVAGLTINPNAAGMGSASSVTMRGLRKKDGSNQALVVIDGVPMHNVYSGHQTGGIFGGYTGTDGIADINPKDIDTISVITGSSAAVLYGPDACNGVIIINTKRGSKGKPKVTFYNSTSFSAPNIMYDFQNTYGNIEGDATSWGEKLATPAPFNPASFFTTGTDVINGVTFSSGTEKNQTYASVSATNSTGIIPTTEYNRYNFSLRNTSKLANDRVTIDLGAQHIIQNNTNLISGGENYNPVSAVYLFPRGNDFADVMAFERWNSTRKIMEQYWPSEKYSYQFSMQNPYWTLKRMTNTMKKQRSIVTANLMYDITDWLNITGRLRWDRYDQEYSDKRHASTTGIFTKGSASGYYGHGYSDEESTYGDLSLNVDKTWNGNWRLYADIGTSFNEIHGKTISFAGGLAMFPNIFSVNNLNTGAIDKSEIESMQKRTSLYAYMEFGWKDLISLTLGGRKDWWKDDVDLAVFYPSAGVSFVASELFDLPSVLPHLKIRASWSEVGNLSRPAKSLEKVSTWEAGFDASFVNKKINVNFTWYQTEYSSPIALSSMIGVLYYNGFQTLNSGIETVIGYSDSYADGKIRFSTSLVMDYNRNKVVQLMDKIENPFTGTSIELEYINNGRLGCSSDNYLKMEPGSSMRDIYVSYMLRRSPNGYIWQNERGEVVSERLKEDLYIGSTLPKFHAGWNTSISYAGINLNFLISGRFGGIVISDTQAKLDLYGVSQVTADARDQGGVDTGADRKADAQNYYETISSMSGAYYSYDATNIRLSEVSISYDLPKKWFRNKLGLNVGLTGKNLCMLYCKAPFDPELTTAPLSNLYQGIDFFMVPGTRSIGFNVRVTF